ncbi:hypothetical protein SAMN05518672_101809 [Chitinophaga sp. CF118]|uniref:hypothetical protein n=1 Tax=Chitinophaga sp. CF118 TaxID=1884367 RepID=UPI0008E6031C|nr:hypothetical protein [Chitinophaga sp. CF118]SFD16062.1 hypothetical protein SAMN05518672_101809 [Chitinophaga sp. CF118]
MNLTILNVPGIQFSKIKPYQHRQKEYHSTGYSGRITESGHVYARKGYYTSIKVSQAWRIGFKNVGNVPVDIMMRFSVYDKYGKLETFAQLYRNLRPGEPAETFFEVQDKKAKILFDTVEIYANDQLLSTTEVMQFMPRMGWGLKSWAVALFMAIFAAMALTEPQPLNFASIILPFFALTIMGAGILNRTPVILMLLLLSLVPFSSHSLEIGTTIMLMGLVYLYFVWKKRHSIKDFLMASATPSM